MIFTNVTFETKKDPMCWAGSNYDHHLAMRETEALRGQVRFTQLLTVARLESKDCGPTNSPGSPVYTHLCVDPGTHKGSVYTHTGIPTSSS